MGMPLSQHPEARRWTADEVRELIDEERAWPRYEFMDGELLVTPAPRPLHQLAVTELLVLVASYVKANAIGQAFASPADIELEADSVVQPDVFVIPVGSGGRIRSWKDVTGLLLAIEVLSPASVRNDRLKKRRYYMRNGVPEYWVVDIEARLVERARPGDDRVELVDERIEWHPVGASEPLVIDLLAFFAEVGGE